MVILRLLAMVTERVCGERLCYRKEDQADRPSLVFTAIYQGRGGTLLRCDWLVKDKGGGRERRDEGMPEKKITSLTD